MTSPHQPVTAAEIANLLGHLRALRPPALGGDITAYTAFLTAKANLLTRIADDEPSGHHGAAARHIAARARAAAAHAHTLAETARSNPKDTP